MSSLSVVCPNQRRYNIKVNPGTLLHNVVEEACLKGGYDVNCCIAKNQNKSVDLSLPFRLSGLPNNATLEVFISEKSREEKVEIALQVSDGRRQVASFLLTSTLNVVLTEFSSKFGENFLTASNGTPCCIYMNKKYIGPELDYITLASMGIAGGKCLIRFDQIEISTDELAKLKEKAIAEQQRIADLSSNFDIAKRENEERSRLEKEREEKFQEEVKAIEEARRKEEEAARKIEKEKQDAMETDQPKIPVNPKVPDNLPEVAPRDDGGWSFDSPFSQLSSQPLPPPQPVSDRLSHLNSMLERMDRSTASVDNMVNIIAESGRLSLSQIESAVDAMESEPELPVFAQPCPRQVVIFSRPQNNQSTTDVSEDFYDVGIDDVKKMQKDLKNEVRLQTQRSLLPKSFVEKKNREKKMEAYKHSVIRFCIGDQLLQVNFNSAEAVSNLFDEVTQFFQCQVDFSLSALLNEPVINSSSKNLIDVNLSPKSTLTVKVKGHSNPVSLLRSDIPRCDHVEADAISREWLTTNTVFTPFVGMVEEERPTVKRPANVQDYQSSTSRAPSAPSGPKWFRHK